MLFETMLVVNGRAVQLEAHFERMRRSAEALRYPALELRSFRETVAGATTNEAVRCVYSDDGTLQATPFPVSAATRERRDHARAITLDASVARTLPEHKLLSHYAVAREALQRAIAQGANEALFSGAAGCSPPNDQTIRRVEVRRSTTILEGTATNLFALRGTTLITASDGILPGVVRAWTLARAAELGLTIEDRPPTRDDVREGAFLTGSLTLLAPLRSLDGDECRAPGDVFDELARLYREEIARQNAPRE